MRFTKFFYVICEKIGKAHWPKKDNPKSAIFIIYEKDIKQGEDISIMISSYFITSNNPNPEYYEPSICPVCGRRHQYRYLNGYWCPYCGDELVSVKLAKAFIPYVGENGNWFIAGTDTGISATCVLPDDISYNILNDKPSLNGETIQGDMEIHSIPLEKIDEMFGKE